MKRQQPDLKVVISVGGFGEEASRRFEFVASSDQTRQNFAKDAVRYCKDHGFDGIQIHSEFPGNKISIVTYKQNPQLKSAKK